jgi:hypothetical protein
MARCFKTTQVHQGEKFRDFVPMRVVFLHGLFSLIYTHVQVVSSAVVVRGFQFQYFLRKEPVLLVVLSCNTRIICTLWETE